jgi:hypothetical protein
MGYVVYQRIAVRTRCTSVTVVFTSGEVSDNRLCKN